MTNLKQSKGVYKVVTIGFAMALVLTACGKTKSDDVAEAEEVMAADTATIESVDSAEALPVVDEPVTGEQAQVAEPVTPDPVTNAVDSPVAAVTSPAPAASGGSATYGVQKGDTLMKIAFNLFGDISQWRTLYETNKDVLANANRLKVGTTLRYEKPASDPRIDRNGDPYLIKNGDTLGSIATDIYGKKEKWRKIYENNRTLIKDPNRIYAGFYLYYQMTEQERQEAEQIKQGTTIAPKLGGTDAPIEQSVGADAPVGEPTTAVSPNVLKGGGLQSLSNRVPASAKK